VCSFLFTTGECVTNECSKSPGGQKSELGLTGVQAGISRDAFLSEVLGENPFPSLLHFPKAAHSSYLMLHPPSPEPTR
jgi:hypothetical protein